MASSVVQSTYSPARATHPSPLARGAPCRHRRVDRYVL